VIWLFVSLCFAGTEGGRSSDAPDRATVRVGLRGVAEQWADPALATVYRSGAPIAALGLGVPLSRHASLEVEVGYRKLKSDAGDALSFEIVPVSVLGEWAFGGGAARPFVSFGPTMTAFVEQHDPFPDGLAATSGQRLAVEARLGVRVDTGLVRPVNPPATSPVKAVDLELYVGRRQSRPIGGRTGLDLAAWRVALGIAVEL